jgi:hypothetical protein
MKNQPIRKAFDENGNKIYTGDIVSQFPNRASRRNILQKSTRNLMYGKDPHVWHIQQIGPKKILHCKPVRGVTY